MQLRKIEPLIQTARECLRGTSFNGTFSKPSQIIFSFAHTGTFTLIRCIENFEKSIWACL